MLKDLAGNDQSNTDVIKTLAYLNNEQRQIVSAMKAIDKLENGGVRLSNDNFAGLQTAMDTLTAMLASNLADYQRVAEGTLICLP